MKRPPSPWQATLSHSFTNLQYTSAQDTTTLVRFFSTLTHATARSSRTSTHSLMSLIHTHTAILRHTYPTLVTLSLSLTNWKYWAYVHLANVESTSAAAIIFSSINSSSAVRGSKHLHRSFSPLWISQCWRICIKTTHFVMHCNAHCWDLYRVKY